MKRGISAAGSAPHWQCGGQGFKSPILHQTKHVFLTCFFYKIILKGEKVVGNNKSIIHFGVRVQKRNRSYKLNRDEFATINTHPSLPRFSSLEKRNAYSDASCNEYRIEWCEEYREFCLTSYDKNINYFSKLDSNEFNYAISQFLISYPNFKEVVDLNDYNETEGYYMMVLDEYKQVYIGKSVNIKKRIQQHWSCTKPFDRTLFPLYNTNSVLSIDFFRALDTTRIYAWKTHMTFGFERDLVYDFPEKFSCNRIGGDIDNPIDGMLTARKHDL